MPERTVCLFGIFNPGYSRSRMVRLGLERAGWRVITVQDRTPGWRKYWQLVRKHRALRGEYDVMVVCFPGQTAMLLARLISRTPIVFDAFTSLYDSDVYDRAVVRPYGFGALWRFLLDFASMHRADFVLVDTEAQREYYQRVFRLRADRIGVLPVGSVETIMRPATKMLEKEAASPPGHSAFNTQAPMALGYSPQRDFTVHFHGHFIPLQGVRVILGAARELVRESVHFNIIGRGQQYDEMRRRRDAWGLTNVRFIESVPYEELPDRMAEADVCLGIFGATAKGARVVPNKAYEALACAKPLITQDSPASREVFTDGVNALLVPANDPAALAAAIRRLRDDPALRDRIARAGHELLLREFTTVRTGERLQALLEDVISRSNIKEQKSKIQTLLVVILLGAFLLRVVGISYGLPYRLVGDEETFVGGALKMLELKQLVPALAGPAFAPFYLPPLIYYAELVLFLPVLGLQYLFSGARSLVEFQQQIAFDPTVVWLAARFLSVVLGTGAVGVVYLIGRDLFNRRAGLIAAVLLATSFFATSLSHFARHWPPSLLVLLVGLWMGVKIRSGLRQGLAPRTLRRWYLAAGLLAGLGFGIDYVSVLGLLFVLTAHVMSGREAWSRRLRSANVWLAVAAAIAVSSLSIALHQSFYRILVREADAAAVVKSVGGFLAVFGYYVQVLWAYEPLLLVAGLAGLGYLIWRDRGTVIFLAVFAVAYLLAFYLFLHQEVRYVLFLLPVLILPASAFIDSLLERWPRAIWPACMIPVAFAAAVLVQFDLLLLRTDTRLLAKQYVEAHVPAGASVVSLLREVRLTPSRASLEAQAALDPASLRSFERALLARPEATWPEPRYELTNLHFLNDDVVPSALAQFFEQPGQKFVLVQYQSLSEATPTTKALRDRSRLLKTFAGRQDGASRDFLGNDLQSVWAIFSFDRLGPIVELRELE